MKLGVRAHDLASKTDLDGFVKIRKEYGFHVVQLVFKKSFASYSYEEDFVKKASDLFKENGI